MALAKLSTKYQVVIPREVRESMDLHEGQTLYFERVNSSELKLFTTSPLKRYAGTMKGAWGSDSTAQLQQERDSWSQPNS